MNYHRNSEIRLPKLELGVRSASLLLCVLYLYVCQMSLMRQWFQFTCLSVRSRLTRARLTHDTSFTLLFHRKLLTFGSPTVIELVSRGKCDRKHTHTKTNREMRTNETNMKRKKKPFQLFSIGLTKLAVVFLGCFIRPFHLIVERSRIRFSTCRNDARISPFFLLSIWV